MIPRADNITTKPSSIPRVLRKWEPVVTGRTGVILVAVGYIEMRPKTMVLVSGLRVIVYV